MIYELSELNQMNINSVAVEFYQTFIETLLPAVPRCSAEEPEEEHNHQTRLFPWGKSYSDIKTRQHSEKNYSFSAENRCNKTKQTQINNSKTPSKVPLNQSWELIKKNGLHSQYQVLMLSWTQA